jgi:C-terminal processing protease CtpA/Prc
MDKGSNIQPFCLLNGKMQDQLFDYTDDELDAFHKVVTPNILKDVFEAVEEEYNIQTSSKDSAELVTNYLSTLTSSELETFSTYLEQEVNGKLTTDATASFTPDVSSVHYPTPKVEMLEGYIAISSSNLQALDKFKDRVIQSSTIEWEHRIKKHGDVTIHSYVFNIKEDSK